MSALAKGFGISNCPKCGNFEKRGGSTGKVIGCINAECQAYYVHEVQRWLRNEPLLNSPSFAEQLPHTQDSGIPNAHQDAYADRSQAQQGK